MPHRVLIVEDQDVLLRLACRRIQAIGHDVLTARDGVEAVAVARAEIPDVLVLDLGLPILDGWGVAKALKESEETRHIPLIALTAHAMEGDREKALAAGCDFYLSKPVSAADLRDALGRALSPQRTDLP